MRIPTTAMAALAVLLGVRFFADVALVAMNPPPETLRQAPAWISGLDMLLVILLVAALVYLAGSAPPKGARRSVFAFRVAVLAVLAATFGTWLFYVSGSPASVPGSLFPPLAIVSVTAGAGVSASFAPGRGVLLHRWWGATYVALLVVVPVVFAMRTAALLGFGTFPGPGGALEGDWSLVYGPTLLLELLAIGVWLLLVSGAPARAWRIRWNALLPFAAALPVVLLFLFGVVPLATLILSATISWGANLAVFLPVEVSLSLALVAIACYASALLWVRRDGARPAWRRLALGTATIALAGFSLSIVSVAGLTYGLVVVACALSEWAPA